MNEFFDVAEGLHSRKPPAQGTSETVPPRYRVGSHLGRTVYRVVGDEASKSDELIGIMDTPGLGALVVEALNARERFLTAGHRPLPPRYRDMALPQSCRDANGEACPPDRCKIEGPHYITHPEVKFLSKAPAQGTSEPVPPSEALLLPPPGWGES